MDNIVCFFINKKRIMLDKVLVEYNSIPIFFICKDENEELYLSLCYDLENYNYYVFKTSSINIYRMLRQEVSIYSIIMNQRYFYDIKSGETIEADIVKKKNIENIDKSLLPEPNAMYRAISDDIDKYAYRLCKKLFSDGNYKKIKFEHLSEENSDSYYQFMGINAESYKRISGINVADIINRQHKIDVEDVLGAYTSLNSFNVNTKTNAEFNKYCEEIIITSKYNIMVA